MLSPESQEFYSTLNQISLSMQQGKKKEMKVTRLGEKKKNVTLPVFTDDMRISIENRKRLIF
jgi:hypothetical protein